MTSAALRNRGAGRSGAFPRPFFLDTEPVQSSFMRGLHTTSHAFDRQMCACPVRIHAPESWR